MKYEISYPVNTIAIELTPWIPDGPEMTIGLF